MATPPSIKLTVFPQISQCLNGQGRDGLGPLDPTLHRLGTTHLSETVTAVFETHGLIQAYLYCHACVNGLRTQLVQLRL